MDELLESTSFIFEDRKYSSIFLDLSNVRSSTLLGKMMIYKVISYIANNNIAETGEIKLPGDLSKSLDQNGFLKLIENYLKDDSGNTRSARVKMTSSSNSFLYPERLLRDDFDKKQISRLLRLLKDMYTKYKNPEAMGPLSICISELLSNFWSHATQETETIFSAEGNAQHFKAVIADNAVGIVSNLKMAYSEYEKLSPAMVLSESILKNVSSKKKSSIETSHMGFGLYLVSEIVKLNPGSLNIWSEGGRLYSKNGKFYSTSCPYWRGTIIEVVLDLTKPKSIEHIDDLKDGLEDIKLTMV